MNINDIIELFENSEKDNLELIVKDVMKDIKRKDGLLFNINNIRIFINKLTNTHIIFDEIWYDVNFQSSIEYSDVKDYLVHKMSIVNNKKSKVDMSIQNGTYLTLHSHLEHNKKMIVDLLNDCNVDSSTLTYYTDAITFNINNELCKIGLSNFGRVVFETTMDMNKPITSISIYHISWCNVISKIDEFSTLLNQLVNIMGNMKSELKMEVNEKEYTKKLITYFYGGDYHPIQFPIVGCNGHNYTLLVERTTNTSIVVKLLRENNEIYFETKFKRNLMNDSDKAKYVTKLVSYLLE